MSESNGENYVRDYGKAFIVKVTVTIEDETKARAYAMDADWPFPEIAPDSLPDHTDEQAVVQGLGKLLEQKCSDLGLKFHSIVSAPTES